jgi:hypothetical protein
MLIGKIKLCLEMLMDVLYLDGINFIAGKDLVSPALGRALPKKSGAPPPQLCVDLIKRTLCREM